MNPGDLVRIDCGEDKEFPVWSSLDGCTRVIGNLKMSELGMVLDVPGDSSYIKIMTPRCEVGYVHFMTIVLVHSSPSSK